MKPVHVKISELAVLRGHGVLVTIGLGSCVGVVIYDHVAKVGGLAHIFLPDSSKFAHKGVPLSQGKFADTAIPAMVRQIEKAGGNYRKASAKIAGGSQLFNLQKANINVGANNVQAVKWALQQLGIPIRGEDTGGRQGRTMRLYVDSGKVTISLVGKEEREI